jgi:hypothetical protein
MCVSAATIQPGAGRSTSATMTADTTVPPTTAAEASDAQRASPRNVATAVANAIATATPKYTTGAEPLPA